MKAKGFLLNVAGCIAGLIGEFAVWMAVRFLLYDVLAKSKIFSAWFSISVSSSGTGEPTDVAFVRVATLVIIGTSIFAGTYLCQFICRLSHFRINWGCIAFSILSALWFLLLLIAGLIVDGFTTLTIIYLIAAAVVVWLGYTAAQE